MLCVVLLHLPRREKIYNHQAYQESKVTHIMNDLTTKMQYPWLWNHEIIFVTASQKCNDFGFPRQGTLFWWSHAGFIHTSGNITAEMSSMCMWEDVRENGGKALHILDLSTIRAWGFSSPLTRTPIGESYQYLLHMELSRFNTQTE